jgi:hypothetical protein
VLKIPPSPSNDDRTLLAEVARMVNDIVLSADDVVGPERQSIVANRIKALEALYH